MSLTVEEKTLLFFPSTLLTNGTSFEKLLLTGKFIDIIVLFADRTFHQNLTYQLNEYNSDNFVKHLTLSINNLLTDVCNLNDLNEYDILLVGIACLYYFIQLNWTGPFESFTCSNGIIRKLFVNDQLIEDEILYKVERNINSYLSVDNELISCNAEQSVLLFLSQLIFRWITTLQSKTWWLMRSLYILQLLIPDPSPSLHDQLFSIMKEIENNIISFGDETLKVLFNLERIQIHLQLFSEVSKVEPLIQCIRDSLHLDTSLIGILGKRTKFQKRDIAQLTLKVNTDKFRALTINDCEWSHLPKDLPLENEVQLSEIKFTENQTNPSLNGIEQAAILAIFMFKKKNMPKDKLQIEELSPYLKYLLSDPKIWCIQVTALLFRSLLEAESHRTIERSIKQIESVISDSKSLNPSPVERLSFVFCSFISPKWKLEMNLAKLLIEVGAIQSALDIYNKLQMWEEIVACYNYLKLRHKAAEVIRREMAVRETVQLWCLLGDATDDETCYQKAWELSDYKSSRAQKHWGLYYFQRKMYEESISHLQKSLDINSLQVSLWFNLGYAALTKENWELSATAFRRYCSLEPDSFESWNNLAKSYIKLGQKDRAWRALQEAVKCNYDNWKVWDNLMAVSTDVAHFDDVIRCYHRILDLKGKHVDIEILRILVNAIGNNLENCDISLLKKQTLELFGRLTSLILNDAELWRLYASLVSVSCEKNNETCQKIVQYLKKAQKISTQQPAWECTFNSCKYIINLSLDLSKALKECCHFVPESEAVQYLNSAKLIMRPISSKIKKVHTDAFGKLNDELIGEIQKLDNEIINIENTLRC
ncbi:hypothetical protein PGB90_009485 [Kerria lacca]